MGTLPSPKTKKFPGSSIEKMVYNIVDLVSEYLPITNDRNRLGFGLYKFMTGEGDPPVVLLKASKLKIEGITIEELAQKIDVELEKIK